MKASFRYVGDECRVRCVVEVVWGNRFAPQRNTGGCFTLRVVKRGGTMNTKTTVLAMLIASVLSGAQENNVLVHKFDIWASIRTDRKSTLDERRALYIGWLNEIAGNEKTAPLVSCIGGIPMPQAIAMIDKFYNDHPEAWSKYLTEGIFEALTVPGGPCGK